VSHSAKEIQSGSFKAALDNLQLAFTQYKQSKSVLDKAPNAFPKMKATSRTTSKSVDPLKVKLLHVFMLWLKTFS
jgi:hypothetical protein